VDEPGSDEAVRPDVRPARAEALLREARNLCASDPQLTFENVWHTLLMLEKEPLERLNIALARGRARVAALPKRS